MQEQPQATGPYTWADFIELGEDDTRELIDGHFMEVDVPTRTHERIVASLITILGHWSWTKNAGEILASGYKVRIHDKRGAMPDIQFYARGNLPKGQEKGLERGHPDLAVEVISPTSRSKDSVQKLQDEFYGDRYGGVKGPCGNFWWIDTHVEDVPPDEIARRMAEARGQK